MSQEENERTYAELMKPFAIVHDFVKMLNCTLPSAGVK